MEPSIFAAFKSWRFWVISGVSEALFQFMWWGVSKLMGFMPLVRDISAAVIFVAVIFALALALPRLVPQYAGGKTKLMSTSATSTKTSRLEHDGVLWEDAGKYMGNINVVGPLCPKDFAVLGSERRGEIESRINSKTLISDSEYHSRLVCPECKSKYTLGTEPKTIQESKDEVRNRFEGKRRREQET